MKVVLTGEGADELFAGYAYHAAYTDGDALQSELHRSLTAMHSINLQRVDRMTWPIHWKRVSRSSIGR